MIKDGTIPLWDNLMGQSPHNGTTPTMTSINHHDISSNGTTCSSTNHVDRHGNYAHYSQTRVRSFFKIKWSGKTKKVAHFCPPLKEGGLSQSSTMKKIIKSALVQIPPANTVQRENIIHISTDQGRAKPWPMRKNIFSKNHVQIQQGNKHKNNHQVDKNACAPKNQHAYLTALGTKRASLAMLFVCGATLTLTLTLT